MKYLIALAFLAAPFMIWAAGEDESAQEIKTVKVWLRQHPTEWTTRTAEHPKVVTAPRILAEEFMKLHPEIKIEFQDIPVWEDAAAYSAYL